MSGQAASYYNANQSFNEPAHNGYQANPEYQHTGEGKPAQEPPPTYNQAVYGFDEAFKVEKPKFNDIWAGLLVRYSRI